MTSATTALERFAPLALLLLGMAPMLAACAAEDSAARTPRILAASSLAGHLDAFTSPDAAPADISFAGTPTVISQAIAGAPADIVFLADAPPAALTATFPDMIATALVDNAITIAVPAGNPAGITGLADLARPELRIAACAADVPCGSILSQLQATIDADTRDPNVRAVLTKVEAGEVDLGLVYATDIGVSAGRVDEVPIETTATTRYWMVQLTPGASHIDDWVDVFATDGAAFLQSRGFRAVATP